ncbi:MAG: CRISPR-associated protein Cas4 [Armatimonadota bacterium]
MFDEEDLLPISGLRHLAFCERRCALMHVEGLWADNRLTAEGQLLHERSHLPELESRGDLRIARALRLHSLRLGLSGAADVVEFHRCAPDAPDRECVALDGVSGLWRPFPVEYKRGHPYPDASDEVQLCAQALCLEEMLGVEVPAGALFYGEPHRRQEVSFTPDLRGRTEALAARLHALVAGGHTPPARYEKRCRSCSLLDLCLPKTAGSARSARLYLDRALADTLREDSS